jgi:hypothetical protein
MTQALIAHILGISSNRDRKCMPLQTASLIDYTKSRIQVLDREGLGKRTCECYAQLRLGSPSKNTVVSSG